MPYPAPKDYPAVISPRRDKTLGYLYFCNKQHPLANKQGRVYLHRHALSLKIGRWLEPGEVTHHKDGDRLNNDPENLVPLRFLSVNRYIQGSYSSCLPIDP